jgi:ABC-type Mn2+/Zn2+ transport system ATPase subunit
LSNSKPKTFFDDDDVRDIELILLKSKIIDAIRFSERYWMIFKEGTFGIATIIDLIYKKSYIEVLFYINREVLKGVPLVKIYTPSATQFDFNEVLSDPDFDEDGTISPVKIIARLNELIQKELLYHLEVLEKEVQLIDEKFENYSINDNPYFRKILLHFPDYIVKLRINFENYPDLPNLSEKKQLVIKRFKEPLTETIKEKLLDLYMITPIEKFGEEIKVFDEKQEIIIEKQSETLISKAFNKFELLLNETYGINIRKVDDIDHIIKETDFNSMDLIKNWNLENPPHIVDLIESIVDVKDDSQNVILNDVSITDTIQNISFKVHRGQSLGIYYYTSELELTDNGIYKLFDTISGKNTDFSGEISIFGETSQLTNMNGIEGVYLASGDIDQRIEHNSIHKAILHNIHIKGRRKNKDILLKKALEVTGLMNRRREKLFKLSKLDRILFTIARALLTLQQVILIKLPLTGISRLEGEQINRLIQNIKRKFHTVLIIHGPNEIISNCDQIITIKENQVEIGNLNYFISKMPQSGDLITIELDNPGKDTLAKMHAIDSALFVEERKNEKYKIYCITEHPNIIINKLMGSIGDYIYTYKIHKASLKDYLELSKINENYVNIE